MMKLLVSALLYGVVTASASSSLRGPQPAAHDGVVHHIDGMPPLPAMDADDAKKYLSPEPPRVTMLYSSMNTEFADLMANQVTPLIDSICGHSVKWDFVPFGKTARVPHPWLNTKYVYDAEGGKIDFVQNAQQLCTLDVFNNTMAGWEMTSCLQSMASQDKEDKRGLEWFDSGDNMKTCFGTENLAEFKAVLDCTSTASDNTRLEAVLDNAVFKTYHLGIEREDLPKVLINYKPADFTKVSQNLRSTICDMDVNYNPACCDYDAEREAQEKKYFDMTQQYTHWAQKTVRKAQVAGTTDLNIKNVPAEVLATFPQEMQDGLKEQAKKDKYITDADLARARGLDVSATQ